MSYHSKFRPNVSSTLSFSVFCGFFLQANQRRFWGKEEQTTFEAAKDLVESSILLVYFMTPPKADPSV